MVMRDSMKWISLGLCALGVVCMTSLAGCVAWVTHSPVKSDAGDAGEGIRYYQSSPYLLVYSDSKGGLKWQVLYLPDQTKKMMADTTELPKAVFAAVQSAASLLVKALEAAAPKVPAPYLYKIVVTGEDIKFIGGQGDTGIIVSIKEANP